MNRIGNARKGIVFGVINSLLNVLLPFVSRTIIIHTLGTEYVGLGGLFASILSVLSLSELGFSAAVSYILYKPVAEGDDRQVRAILNFTRKCFFVVGCVVFAGGIAVLPFLDSLISGDIPQSINIYVLFAIYLLNTAVSYWMFAYKRVLFSANQRYDIETNIASVVLLSQYVLQIVMLILFRNYYLYALVVLVMTIVSNLLCQIVTRKKYPQYFCEGKVTREEVQALKQKVLGSFFSKLGETVYLSVDNIVISAMFGLLILGRYGNYYYVISSLIAIFAVVHNTLRPIIGNCIVKESKEVNFNRFLKINNLYLWIAAFCACCLLCLYQDFILVWIGAEGQFSMWLVILFAVYFFAGRMSSMPTLYAEAAGLWWEGRFVSAIAAAVNLTLNIVLSSIIGLPGILISSIVSAVLVTLIGRVRILFRHYFQKGMLSQYLASTGRIGLLAVLSIGVTYLLVSRITVSGWAMLIGKGALTAVIFGVLFFAVNITHKQTRETWKLAATMLGLDRLMNRFFTKKEQQPGRAAQKRSPSVK